MVVIQINGNRFDPEQLQAGPEYFGANAGPGSARNVSPLQLVGSSQATVQLPADLLSRDASETGYIIIQTRGPLKAQHKYSLQEEQVDIQEYISKNTYLCRYLPESLDRIRDLPFVNLAFPYHQNFKVDAGFYKNGFSSSDDPEQDIEKRNVDIILHESMEDELEDIVKDLYEKAGIEPESIDISHGKLRLAVDKEMLEKIATVDRVKAIEEAHPVEIYNDFARNIIRSSSDGQVDTDVRPYRGRGETIVIADTGFDIGSVNDTHPAFEGRVSKLIPIGRDNRTDDPQGHGTHVCGSALGDAVSKQMGGPITGTAPEAKLVVQSLLNDEGGLFNPVRNTQINDILKGAYDLGARIHSNSWGPCWGPTSEEPFPYNNASRDVDNFVKTSKDMVVCFAAGNDGKKPSSTGGHIGAQAASKNCITVGASETSRPHKNGVYDPKTSVIYDLRQVADFSSRGPTLERRIKPDVVAPGTVILSAASRKAKSSSSFGVCPDKKWKFDSGTSMATPFVAGCVAVLRSFLIEQGVNEPSAALIKALIINGATEIEGSIEEQGFGLVNLPNSLIKPDFSPTANFKEFEALDQEEEATVTIQIPNRVSNDMDNTLKVTLVYSDDAGPVLQNDLNLEVIASDGRTRYGNKGDFETDAASNEEVVRDEDNNVEQVVWRNPPPGPMTVKVIATRVTKGKQDFAVVWRIEDY